MNILFQIQRPSFILFYLITILWIGEFWIFPNHYKGADRNETKSFLRILGVILISHAATITFTALGWFRIDTLYHPLWIISLITYPLGLLLRYVSILYLGHHFTRNVEVSKSQTLISKGPYRYLRHPLYLGLFLLTISVPLFFQNWLMTIISSILMFYILNNRMILEETMMEQVIGDSYRQWKRQRYRFFPWLY